MDSGDKKLKELEDALKGFLEAINPVEGTVEPIVPDAVIDQVTGLVDRLEKKLEHIILLLQSQIDDDQRHVLFESFYGDFIATLRKIKKLNSQELNSQDVTPKLKSLLNRAQEMLEYAEERLRELMTYVDPTMFDSDEDRHVHSDSDIDVGRMPGRKRRMRRMRRMRGSKRRKRGLRAYKLRF